MTKGRLDDDMNVKSPLEKGTQNENTVYEPTTQASVGKANG